MQESTQSVIEVLPSEFSKGDWVRVIWGILWRGLCTGLASGLAGMIVGFILGFVVGAAMHMLGIPQASYRTPLQVFGGVLGAAIGFYMLVWYVRWLLKARFRSFRLAFVRISPSSAMHAAA